MLRPIEIAIGLRYTRAKRRNHFISFMSSSSILGIAVGVMALITVLSVMNGFERELREKILGMVSHATISGPNGTLEDWSFLRDRVRRHEQVVDVAPYVEGQGMLTYRSLMQGIMVRGVLPEEEPAVSRIDRHLIIGSLDSLEEGAFRILLGKTLAQLLGVRVGDKVTMVVPQASVTPAGILPRMRRFTVAGIFEIAHAQYDSGLALVHLADGARLFRLGNRISGLRIMLPDVMDAPRISRKLARELDGYFWVRDWTQYHANFFRAVKTEKTVMFIILTLIVAVAAFNIVSALVMVVTDKEADIAILRTLGASPASIMWIFIAQGTLIGFTGTLLGAASGIGLATNIEALVPRIEAFFDIKFLSPDVYYISNVPADMRWSDVGIITSMAFILCVLATLYPAWRAARTQPAEALRYE
uniref:Lipoprotein-releasing system permease protein n=1 Tax=Candidatus Kentrum sp. LFY TaxID=2126342 RepID=A0A450WB20_9GAMM|nr:MAG: lipoprotein-releasing system permease protein [Candidatus Kentron sp. LFY]VFJ96328.1 MAG: lipoprotein-releasing system permease protein [Candidatus Kentron sp. LFY]VFK14208.1 MAG: lipoprotein-releasing system permease protein [Candidatus Kentron sp. LFY]